MLGFLKRIVNGSRKTIDLKYHEKQYEIAFKQSNELTKVAIKGFSQVQQDSEYLDLLKYETLELKRANEEMEKILDKEYSDAAAAGKAAAAEKIAKMSVTPYERRMKAFQEALDKGKTKKD